ncbi:MAG: hypothetical protein HZB29_06485 [Nitrospinae bacterium]|nr:hypothetical protein [Nitrospinota bacterium]
MAYCRKKKIRGVVPSNSSHKAYISGTTIKLLALIIAAFLVSIIPANAARRKTIAVLDFKAISKLVATGPGVSVVGWDEKQTNMLTADFITSLVKTNKFDVLERERVNDVLKEQLFSDSGMVSGASAVRMGKMLGADYLIMGQIELVDIASSARPIPYTNMVQHLTNGEMIVNMRIVDSRSGRIVSADKVDVTDSSKERKHLNALNLLESLKEKTVSQLVNGVLESIFPTKIVKVENNTVFLNRGHGSNFRIGSFLTVFRVGEDMIDPDTGASLGASEFEVAKIRIIDIQPKFSKAQLLGTTNEVKVGYICRVSKEIEKKAPQQVDDSKEINW